MRGYRTLEFEEAIENMLFCSPERCHLGAVDREAEHGDKGHFHKNVVSEYTHEKAVADGVNVGNKVYMIETQITQGGAKIKVDQLVEKRERMTRAKRWQSADADEDYASTQLDRSVVNPDQIRTVIKAFREKLPEIFPGRAEA